MTAASVSERMEIRDPAQQSCRAAAPISGEPRQPFDVRILFLTTVLSCAVVCGFDPPRGALARRCDKRDRMRRRRSELTRAPGSGGQPEPADQPSDPTIG